MIDRATLTVELRRQVTAVEDDLRRRAGDVPAIGEVLAGEWQRAHEAQRTQFDERAWSDALLTQVASAWVLATVFVRFGEDNGLLMAPVLSGPGERRRQAVDAQTLFFRAHPAEGERAYLLDVFERVRALPGLSEVLGAHNPLWLFGPSDDACRALLDYWRDTDPETGALRRPLTSEGWDTRFLGDLYQDLSESARKQYALLQTPDFVEAFILDRTLEPAIEEFGLDGFRMIDPACGSGHFLLGAFDRLFRRWQAKAPQEGDRALAERALRSVYGVDLNPFAVAIARFRLLVAATEAAGVATLAEAPDFTFQVATGDSLLHGPPPGQQVLPVEEEDPATRHLFATEDGEQVKRYLNQHYHAVVANPPYITPKDPAANAAYRRRFPDVCHRQYSLAVPFNQRLFDLAERGAQGRSAGYVGQITANSFMKREFGKKLIEDFLAKQVDLTHVLDTSGAYIPGHGTPTVILFGRNRLPVASTVRAVLGIRGEPSKPADPAKGLVWSSITSLVDHPGSEDDFVSVADLGRSALSRHPWSLQGGGADTLKARIESFGPQRLLEVIDVVGFGAVTREDDVFLVGEATCRRSGVAGERLARPLLSGEELRDWAFETLTLAIWPYDDDLKFCLSDAVTRFLWPWKAQLSIRIAYGKTQLERGLAWQEYSMFFSDRFRTPLSIAFAFVATHNHFVLDRGGKVFKQTAPLIKLPRDATEPEHLALLGLLNSSTACFWMKQVFGDRGAGGGSMGIRHENWERFWMHDATKLQQFPIPAGSALTLGTVLDRLARELSDSLPAAVVASEVPTRALLNAAGALAWSIQPRMVAAQEELDWQSYFLYGVTAEDLSLPSNAVPPIAKGERAFEIALARQMVAGQVETSWFVRHGSTPIVEVPSHWPAEYRALVERRLALIESDRFVNLLERPEYKRRWNWESWDKLEAEALRSWLLDRVDAPQLWEQPHLRSVAQLADLLRADADFRQVAELYRRSPEVDLTALVGELVADEAVPYLAAWRYTATGLRTRAVWEATWDLQRREDAGEGGGTIPVPPKYGSGDFASKAIWSLRGKLDVPKERFVSYPGAGRETDPTLLIGWAGWDHLQQASALAAWYQERRNLDGWGADKLTPVLAGLAELVPWLLQWHDEPDPTIGMGMGTFFADFVATECRDLGLTSEALRAWAPPAPTRGRKRKTV